MKSRLLSSHEESVMRAYVEQDVKLQGFSVIKHRLLKQRLGAEDFKKLQKQLTLILLFKSKLKKELGGNRD